MNQFVNVTEGVLLGAPTSNLSGLILDCPAATSGSSGVTVGSANVDLTGPVTPSQLLITDCESAFKVSGHGAWIKSATSITATGVTYGFNITEGGRASYSTAPATPTTGIYLDSGAVTGAFTSLASGDCLQNLATNSKVCRD